MAEFEPIFEKVIDIEGGYHLHTVPGDRGGMTYAGISRIYHPAWAGWKKIDAGNFDAELTRLVRDFYREEFWQQLKGDEIGSQQAAYHIFAFAVNADIPPAVRIVQQIVGTTPDGVLGDKTLRALNAAVQDTKDETSFVLLYSLMKIFRYKNICLHDKRRKKDKLESNLKFLCGWINRVQKGLVL